MRTEAVRATLQATVRAPQSERRPDGTASSAATSRSTSPTPDSSTSTAQGALRSSSRLAAVRLRHCFDAPTRAGSRRLGRCLAVRPGRPDRRLREARCDGGWLFDGLGVGSPSRLSPPRRNTELRSVPRHAADRGDRELPFPPLAASPNSRVSPQGHPTAATPQRKRSSTSVAGLRG